MSMTKEKRAKLEAAGFKLTDTKDWIGLTIEESRIVEMRVALAQELVISGKNAIFHIE